MKILYIGNEQRDAQTVAKSLRGITQNVRVTWAQSLDQFARYLALNRDLAAVVIDASIHAGKWPSSLKDLRSLPLRPAIVVVVPHGPRPTFDSQTPPADDYVINGQTFSDDLPITVSRSVARLRGSQPSSTPPNNTEQPKQRPVTVTPHQTVDALFLDAMPTAPSELEQKLARLTAEFRHAERRHTTAMAAAQAAHEQAATEQLTEQECRFQGQMALERDKRRTIEETLSAATSAREEAERRCASALTDAAAQRREFERISERAAELVAQSQSERAMRAAFEQKIVQADAHVRELQQRHDEALTKAAGELAEQRAHFDRELSRASLERDHLQQRVIATDISLDEARREHESAAADVARLTQRETDLSAQLATVHSELLTVQGHLSNAVREVEETRESAAREHAAAETRLELTLVRESEARETLERKLDEIGLAAADVERALRDEVAALRAQALERQVSFDAQLASERLDYDNRLAGMHSECERLGQACAAANTDVERLNADLSDARRVIEVTRREFQDACDRQSTEHATAIAALAAQIAERDERSKEEALHHDAVQQASERARAELQESLQTALAAGRHDIDQVQQALMATLEAVRATRRQQDILQTKADRIAEAQEQQPESQATNARVVRQPDIAAWQQLTKDPALV
jgi:hypothetical protein